MVKDSTKNSNKYSELEYRRKWLYQLQAEFKLICSWYKISLAVPAFRLIESRRTLGLWNPDTRTISISSILIHEYSWDTVINVLKHEMAHQYVHEFLKRGMEQPHGPAFLDSCEKLGVLYPFNTASGDTPKIFLDTKQHGSDTEYNNKLNKVRKMLSLAGSANKYEAAAAMSKANSFICKYNLERLDKVEPAQYSYEIKNTGKKRLNIIKRRVASLLMDYFYVDVVYSELFNAEKAELHKTIELLGSIENVSFASHVYDFLMQRIEFLWKNYRKVSRAPGKLRKTYILGLLQGFREKLEKDEKKQSVSVRLSAEIGNYRTISSLVIAKDPGLPGFIAKRFPRLRKVQYGAPGIYCSNTYSAGKAEGGKIIIHKAVRQEHGNRGRLLSN
ncbi:MAG: SprT-like domain-containing protein [Desulfobacterales bacterium]